MISRAASTQPTDNESEDWQLVAMFVRDTIREVCHVEVSDDAELASLPADERPLVLDRLIQQLCLPLPVSHDWLAIFHSDAAVREQSPIRTVRDLIGFSASKVFSIPFLVPTALDSSITWRMLETIRDVMRELELPVSLLVPHRLLADALTLNGTRRLWTRLHWLSRARFPPFTSYTPVDLRRYEPSHGWFWGTFALVTFLVVVAVPLGGGIGFLFPALLLFVAAFAWMMWDLGISSVGRVTRLPRGIRDWTFLDLATAVGTSSIQPSRRPHRHVWVEGRGWIGATPACPDCWHDPVGACRHCEGAYCEKHGGADLWGETCQRCFDNRCWKPLLAALVAGTAATAFLAYGLANPSTDRWTTGFKLAAGGICALITVFALRDASRRIGKAH